MKSLVCRATDYTPEIILSPEENRFLFAGKSAPEDVRELYYPVVEWMREFTEELTVSHSYTEENPLLMKMDLEYFNSSTAKFLYDIFSYLKEISDSGIPVAVEWHYDEEDTDLRDAGEDLSLLCGLPFRYCPKTDE